MPGKHRTPRLVELFVEPPRQPRIVPVWLVFNRHGKLYFSTMEDISGDERKWTTEGYTMKRVEVTI